MSNVTTKSIGKAYQAVKVFNSVAGNLTKVDAKSIDAQITFIFSELEETISAFEKKDSVEIVDGACDLFVTVAGLMQKLEVAGFNVDEALERVNENNMSKYPSSSDFTSQTIHKVVGEGHAPLFNKTHSVWVIKDLAGKIRKPTNFKSVDLSDCVPEEFFKKEEITTSQVPVATGWFAKVIGGSVFNESYFSK